MVLVCHVCKRANDIARNSVFPATVSDDTLIFQHTCSGCDRLLEVRVSMSVKYIESNFSDK